VPPRAVLPTGVGQSADSSQRCRGPHL